MPVKIAPLSELNRLFLFFHKLEKVRYSESTYSRDKYHIVVLHEAVALTCICLSLSWFQVRITLNEGIINSQNPLDSTSQMAKYQRSEKVDVNLDEDCHKLSNIFPELMSAFLSLHTPFLMRLLSLTVAILLTSAYASSGDRSQEFIECVDLCRAAHCGPHFWDSLSLALRVTCWSCTDDCKYGCMHQITDRDIENGRKVQQYHGKWPFWRLAGMQEPASVAFSLLNLWAHVRGASKIRKRVPESHPMRSYYLLLSIVGINAWIWSAVFHTRGELIHAI